MKQKIPYQLINWNAVSPSEHPGEAGKALWFTKQFEGLRVRIVEYSAGYIADHWCSKKHIVHCLEGSLTTEMETGEKYSLHVGMTYIVSDELSSHRSVTKEKVKLLIIDGDFLK